MIKIVVKVTVKPGKAEDFKNIAAELVAETRKEEGCISYQLFQDNQNPDLLFFIEEWTNGEALNAHRETKHFKDCGAKLPDLLAKDMEINRCTLVI
ncbi:MAG: putative quinol monooxygenase [Peptococcia bacterium]